MKFDRTRSVSLRAACLAALLVWAAAVPTAGAYPGGADGSPDTSGFVPGPSNPAPPFVSDFLSGANGRQLEPVPMPQDRAADSYRIYSVLMPVGELANPGWPRKLWLLSDTTLALIPPERSCAAQDMDGSTMNPHVAIQAPADREQDFEEMLDDFDQRCHERVQLTPESFNLVVPLKLLSETEQDEFVRVRFDPNAGPEGDELTARYKGAPGLSRFSEVYFNAHHTLAMVYASGWCGGVCAQSYWRVLEFRDGSWQQLPWRTASMTN